MGNFLDNLIAAVSNVKSIFEMLYALLSSSGQVLEALNSILRVLGKLTGN